MMTNPSEIDSSKTPEAGVGESTVTRTIAGPARQSCAGVALNPKPFQDVGLVETQPQSRFSETDAQRPGTTDSQCLISQCLDAFDALPNVPSNSTKASQRDCVKKSFYAGMYTHGGISDLRSTCREHVASSYFLL